MPRWRRSRSPRADVVLMDVRMPRLDGVEATRRLLAGNADAPKVIVLTTFDLDEHVFAALRAGASGFLLKDAAAARTCSPPSARCSAATRWWRRARPAGCSSTSTDALPDGAGEDPRLERLTPREREVLLEVARGRSNAEIAADLFMAEATVKTHVGRLLAKLDLRDRVQLAVFAYDAGLVRPRR